MPTKIQITAEDIRRGWSEIEVEFTDGTREFLRVHAIDPVHLPQLVSHEPDDQITALFKKSLRADANFIARIRTEYQMTIAAMLARLTLGDPGGVDLLEATPAMRSLLTLPTNPALQNLAHLTPAAREAFEVSKRAKQYL